MKATGIVRRIDDLGRVVIPKEIRRTLRIREGDPLEIYTERDGEVIFKKYSPMGDLAEFASQLCEALNKSTDRIALICDRDTTLAVAGAPRRELAEKRISSRLETVMEGRKLFRMERGAPEIPVLEGEDKYFVSVAAPILSEGDLLGCVLFAAPAGGVLPGEVETKLAGTVAAFLGRQMES